MKKIVKITLAMILVCSIALAVMAPMQADTIFTDKGFSYTQLDANYASICDWEGGSDTMKIPLMLNDSYVREIAGWSFNGRDDFSSVDFTQADYLNAINASAFKNCVGITGSINIPAQVASIGVSAFQGCNSIETLYYNTTAAVPNQCFYFCSSLREVTLTAGVSSIGRFAFANCENLEYVWIPTTVTYIDSTAFNNCPNLVIYCYTDSFAHQYAIDKGVEFVLIDAPDPTEPATEAPTDEPTETPSEVPTEVPTESVSFILGDADGDGIITIVDATVIQRVLVLIMDDPDGMIELRASVDGDELNITHATKIQRFLAEMEVPDPIGTEVTRIVPVHTQG